MSISDITLPAHTMRGFTEAQISLLEVSYLAAFTNEAVKNFQDPLDRLKVVTTAMVAGMTYIPTVLGGQPAIPGAVGSTLTADMPGGIKLYYEHFGPQKTDSRILVVGQNDSFRIHSHNKTIVSANGMTMTSMKGNKARMWMIETKDGFLYNIKFPEL